MKQKAFHILPALNFITARFKSHIRAKMKYLCKHYFYNNHFNIIIVLQCISINVTNSQIQAESGYTTVFSDRSDCQTEVNCYCLFQVSGRTGWKLFFLVIIYAISFWFHLNSSVLIGLIRIIYLFIYLFIHI